MDNTFKNDELSGTFIREPDSTRISDNFSYSCTTSSDSPDKTPPTQLNSYENVSHFKYEDEDNHHETSNKDLKQTNSDLEAFCSTVSHELRAPLQTILGYTQLLLISHNKGLDDKSKKCLKTIESSSMEMEDLITALLHMSRSGREEIQKTTVNLSMLSNNVVSDLSAHNTERKVHVIIQEGLTTQGDEDLLQIVMTNLINNAWKYTGKTEGANIEIGSFVQNNQTIFYVEDNGDGFDESQQDKLFTPFKRLHKQKDFAGNGIGLSTVQRIINKHGGRIWAESIESKGATFLFTL